MFRIHKPLGLVLILPALLLGGCATLPKGFDRPVSYAYKDTGDTVLGKLSCGDEAKNHPGQSGFLLLDSGLDAFVARALLADRAERSIDAQYYMLHDDLTGSLFIDRLLKAADRGIRVRLLVDDMNLTDWDRLATVLDKHPNMEVRIFNPFSRNLNRIIQCVTRLGSVTRRMHNKTFTVDNQATILGGRNIGDEYFNADSDVAFKDLDVLMVGPVVKAVSASFDKYWNSDLAYPASVLRGRRASPVEVAEEVKYLEDFIAQQKDSSYLRALRLSDLARKIRQNCLQFHWGDAEVVYDQPEKILHDTDKSQFQLAPKLRPYFQSVEKELIIFSPYFVPGEKGVALLSGLRKRGVRVCVLTNSLASTDVGIVHAGYSKYRKDLLRAGIELYELNEQDGKPEGKVKKGLRGSSRASLHAKSILFDRRKVFIGSLNMDPRSVSQNTEVGVILESPETAGEMGAWFDRNIEKVAFRLDLRKRKDGTDQILWHGYEDGEMHVFTVDPHTSFWRRMGLGLISILPIESQL